MQRWWEYKLTMDPGYPFGMNKFQRPKDRAFACGDKPKLSQAIHRHSIGYNVAQFIHTVKQVITGGMDENRSPYCYHWNEIVI